jgi:biopolymer transport protein ExbD
VVVDIDERGDVRVGNAVLSGSALSNGMAAQTKGSVLVFVRASATCEWDKVIRVLDAIVQANKGAPEQTPAVELVVDADRSRHTARVVFPRGPFEATVVRIDIDRAGSMMFEGEGVPNIDSLRKRLASSVHEGIRVVVNANSDAPFGIVVDATRAAQGAGAAVAFGVAPPEAAFARPLAASWKACPFPPESDKAKIDSAVVLLRSKVDAEGQATHVSVITDPGHGFGAAAVACAMREKYQPARDTNGRAIAGETKPFRVRFER